jgi:LmbE family N-acetylglucosaminyl deacetylase
MLWIYLSPHFDDIALSCGGLVWEQSQAGDTASIWTVCAGKPPSGELSPFAQELHTRWQTEQEATEERRLEDLLSCLSLGASSRHFNIPDCIYRRHPQTSEFLYASEAALNGPLHPADTQVMALLQAKLKPLISNDMVVVSPLGLGKHVDHQLSRLALEGLGCASWYFQDYPYVLHSSEQVGRLEADGWTRRIFPISDQGLAAWQDSIAIHASQISTFWPDETAMRQAISDYFHWNHGVCLWRKPA